MFAKTNNKIMDKIIGFLRYDMKKALNMYIAVLMIVPIVFFAYIGLALNLSQMGLRTYFDKSPISAVMFIVCLVDLIVAYVLFFKKTELVSDRKNVVTVFTALTLFQLAVGNLISLVLGIIVLYLSKDISSNKKLSKDFMYLLIGCTPLYVTSALFLINMGIH
jgi:hypothetical protein